MPETTAHHENQPEPAAPKKSRRGLVLTIVALALVAAIGGGVYWYVSQQTVYVDDSLVSAPLIELSPAQPGILQAIYVNAGDIVPANTPVAEVGDETIDTKVAGEIVSVDQTIGADLDPLTGNANVASMIDPTQLRVVGSLDENAGLDEIQVGDRATFTVDAFGSEQFQGVVDEISPTSQQSDVVFDISDQRPTNQFDVYVRFDPAQYPELKNGMSARIWVYRE